MKKETTNASVILIVADSIFCDFVGVPFCT